MNKCQNWYKCILGLFSTWKIVDLYTNQSHSKGDYFCKSWLSKKEDLSIKYSSIRLWILCMSGIIFFFNKTFSNFIFLEHPRFDAYCILLVHSTEEMFLQHTTNTSFCVCLSLLQNSNDIYWKAWYLTWRFWY